MSNEELKLEELVCSSESADSDNSTRVRHKASRVNWQRRAKELEISSKRDISPQPSEWWFMAYALLLIWRSTQQIGRCSIGLVKGAFRLKLERQEVAEGIDVEQT